MNRKLTVTSGDRWNGRCSNGQMRTTISRKTVDLQETCMKAVIDAATVCLYDP